MTHSIEHPHGTPPHPSPPRYCTHVIQLDQKWKKSWLMLLVYAKNLEATRCVRVLFSARETEDPNKSKVGVYKAVFYHLIDEYFMTVILHLHQKLSCLKSGVFFNSIIDYKSTLLLSLSFAVNAVLITSLSFSLEREPMSPSGSQLCICKNLLSILTFQFISVWFSPFYNSMCLYL